MQNTMLGNSAPAVSLATASNTLETAHVTQTWWEVEERNLTLLRQGENGEGEPAGGGLRGGEVTGLDENTADHNFEFTVASKGTKFI